MCCQSRKSEIQPGLEPWSSEYHSTTKPLALEQWIFFTCVHACFNSGNLRGISSLNIYNHLSSAPMPELRGSLVRASDQQSWMDLHFLPRCTVLLVTLQLKCSSMQHMYVLMQAESTHNVHIQTTLVDLERKIAAIAQVDSSLNSTSTQEQVMINVLYHIKHILVKQ